MCGCVLSYLGYCVWCCLLAHTTFCIYTRPSLLYNKQEQSFYLPSSISEHLSSATPTTWCELFLLLRTVPLSPFTSQRITHLLSIAVFIEKACGMVYIG